VLALIIIGAVARFQNDRELHWRDHGIPLADS
jgi:hypothetical protein